MILSPHHFAFNSSMVCIALVLIVISILVLYKGCHNKPVWPL